MHTGTESWSRIVRSVHSRVPDLAAEFVSQFRQLGYYREGVVSDEELRGTAEDILGLFIRQLDTGTDDAQLAAHAHELGRRRLRQGVPLTALVDAIQIDFTVLWRCFKEVAGSDQLDVLVDHVEEIQAVVSRYTLHIRNAYAHETARTRQDARLAHARHIERLFAAEHLSPMALTSIAHLLGMDPEAEVDLLAFRPESWTVAQSVLEPALVRGDIFGHAYRGIFAAFGRTGDPASAEALALAEKTPGISFAALPGIESVRAAVRGSVDIFAAASHPSRMVDSADIAYALTAQQFSQVFPRRMTVLHEAVSKLAAHNPDVVETVEAYLRSGSPKEVSEALFCHRNTVVNRLNQFRAQTGLDATVPADAALALAVLQWGGPPSSPPAG